MTAQLVLWLALAASGPGGGVVAGRVAIYEGRALSSLRRVSEVTRRPVGLALRRERQMFDLPLTEDGFFALRLPPGVYRLESVALGDRAELLPPQEIEVHEGQLGCVGTLAVSVPRLELLGESTSSKLSVVDDCRRMLPYLRRLSGWPGTMAASLPRPVPAEEPARALTLPDLLCGLRAEASWNGSELALRGWYVYPLTRALGDPGAMTFHLAAARVSGPAGDLAVELAAGPGVDVLGLVELVGVAGVRLGAGSIRTAPELALIVRAGFTGAGIDLRAQWTPDGPQVFVGVDVAPFFALGTLL